MYQFKHIAVILFTILCSTGLYAQVHIGDGLTIGDGANIIISNQDVVINTDEIKGEGNLIIRNATEQNITVNSNLETESDFKIHANEINVEGKHARKFSAKYLPQLSNEIKIAAKREQQTSTEHSVDEDLPIRYVNVEGLVFGTKDEEKPNDPIYETLPVNQTDGLVLGEVFQIQAVQLIQDYIIPIYSTLNDVRFSDDAKLYEFESLTAIFKPPIV